MDRSKKDVLIGLIVGLIANTFGSLLYIVLFSKLGILETLKVARQQDHLGSILALGAILNLLAFFGFLRLKRDYRARGVMIATVITALTILYFKVF